MTVLGTTSRGYPYPGDVSAADVPADLKALADAISADVGGLAGGSVPFAGGPTFTDGLSVEDGLALFGTGAGNGVSFNGGTALYESGAALKTNREFDALDLIARPGTSARVGIGDVGGGVAGIIFGGPSGDTTLERPAAGVLALNALAGAAGLAIQAAGTSTDATLALAARSPGGVQRIGSVAIDSTGKMYVAPGVAAQGITFTTPGVAVDAAAANSAAAIYLAGRDGSNTQLVGSVSVDAAGKMYIVPGVAAQGAFFATALVAIDPAVANSSAGLLIVGRNGSNTPLNGAISVDQAGKMVLVPGVLAQGVTIAAGAAAIDPAVASTPAGLAIFARDAGNAQKGAAFSVSTAGDATIDTAVAGRSMVLGSSATNKLGFYGATGAVKQTGVAVTAAAIHAALVSVGLIAA